MLYIIVLALIASILAALFITQRAALISVLIGIFIATGVGIFMAENQQPENTGINAPATANAPPSYDTMAYDVSEELLEIERAANEAMQQNDASEKQGATDRMPLTEAEKRAIEASLKPEIESKTTKQVAAEPVVKAKADKADKPVIIHDNDTLLSNLKAEKPRKPVSAAPASKPVSKAVVDELATQKPDVTLTVQQAVQTKKRKILLVNQGVSSEELDALATYTEQRGTVRIRHNNGNPSAEPVRKQAIPQPPIATQQPTPTATSASRPARRVLLVDGDVTERDEIEAISEIAPAAGSTADGDNPLRDHEPVDLNAIDNPSHSSLEGTATE